MKIKEFIKKLEGYASFMEIKFELEEKIGEETFYEDLNIIEAEEYPIFKNTLYVGLKKANSGRTRK